MRASQFLLATVKETPADAEVISHQLMLRAGMIRKLASGLYTWLPLGLRSLRKVEQIIREEMNKSGAQEVLMPAIQPAELWQESGRWEKYGPELLRVNDRHNRAFCVGPTHEEVITDLARNELHSYKQLPCNLYQIQTKFRDEIRPRFGIMRSREFIMKDAYSFHSNQSCLEKTYNSMHLTYSNIFERIGLDYRPVQADTGSIGGNASHEFHVLASSGEDNIAFSNSSDYAANVELAKTLASTEPRPESTQEMQIFDTPNAQSIADLTEQFNIPAEQTVKTLVVKTAEDYADSPLIALVLRGDHQLNELKAEKLPEVAHPLCLATEEEIRSCLNVGIGSIGPVALKIPYLVDHAAAQLADFTAGANEDGKHYSGINWQRDVALAESVDLRNVVAGDPSPDGTGTLEIKRGIEVGHIFQLGTKYAQTLNAKVLDEQGKSISMEMGCYGIGVSRIIAASIEQNHDEKGIIWSAAIAPFQVAIVALKYEKSEAVQQASEQLYKELTEAGLEVFLDDRPKVSPGVKFADMELIGIPHRVVISERGLESDQVEYKGRLDQDEQETALADIAEKIKQLTAV